MIISRQNNRIEFLSLPSETIINDYGEPDETLQPEFKLWADISKSTLKEYRESDISDKGTHKIVFLVDYRASLKVKREMIIRFKGEDFNIIDIERDYGSHDMTKIMAQGVTK